MAEQAVNIFSLFVCVVQALLIWRFLIQFTGAKNKPMHYVMIGLLFLLIYWLSFTFFISSIVNQLMIFAVFVLCCIFLLKCTVAAALTGALVTIAIMSVLTNISNSIITLASDSLHVNFVFVISIMCTILFTIILWLFLRYVAAKFSFANHDGFPYLFTLWLPLSIIFIFSEVFAWATTGNTLIVNEEGFGYMPVRLTVPGWWGLLIFLFALACIIVLFFSYHKFRVFYGQQQQAIQLEQEVRWQKSAIEEAVVRDENTKAFRHDLNNNLSVLHGLIGDGLYEDAKKYLNKITAFADALSPEIHSGNVVLDVLLNEKTGMASGMGIAVDCRIEVGKTTIDDYDLCVLVGNALDNAIKACEAVPDGEKYIDIEITRKKDFLYIKITNSTGDTVRKGQGYGIKNMRTVVDKYSGSMKISNSGNVFELTAILSV